MIFDLMSTFQNRTTSNPSALSCCVRAVSASILEGSECCEPSSSTISIASSHRKSAMKGPHGACLRNFRPSNLRSRKHAHSLRSSGVCRRRNPRATCISRSVIAITHHAQSKPLTCPACRWRYRAGRDILSPRERTSAAADFIRSHLFSSWRGHLLP